MHLPEKNKYTPTTEQAPTTAATPEAIPEPEKPEIIPEIPKAQLTKKNYTLMQLERYAPLWWQVWQESMVGDNADMKKTAFTEFNKLQARSMPDQMNIAGKDGQAVGVILLPRKND